MIKKKSKFLTFIFSTMFGAGHMYMGFMKRGVSFMGLFFLTIFLSSWLRIGPLMYLMPVLWFYSFFECLNITSLSPEEFSLLRDRYLFQSGSSPVATSAFSRRLAFYGGILLVLFGVYLILSMIRDNLTDYMTNYAVKIYSTTMAVFPQIFFSVVIILIGIRLIMGKKKELENRD